MRGGGPGGRTLAFFGDLLMRPWAANPRWVTSFDDFPLDSVAQKADLFAQAADEDWIVVLSHEREHPIGRLVRDRDRFRYEATELVGQSYGRRGRIASIAATAAASSTVLPTDAITPSGRMKNCVGRPNTRYRRKTCPDASKPIV